MKVTPLSGTDYPVTDASYSAALWLLMKFSSVAFIERCCRLLGTFNREYTVFAGSPGALLSPQGYRDILERLYDYQARFERGILRLKTGDPSGYADIRDGTEFCDYVFSRGFDYGEAFGEVGYHRRPGPTGLFVWMDRAADMAVLTRRTLLAEWTFERLFTPPVGAPPILPAQVPPLIRPARVEIVGKSQEVARSGVWQPVDVPKGCPNYLLAGAKGIPLLVPTKRIEDPLLPGEPNNPPLRATLDYEFKPVSTKWQLIWADTRYRNGVIPNESQYLDPKADFPEDGIEPMPPIA
jgi:hypothetical protein